MTKTSGHKRRKLQPNGRTIFEGECIVAERLNGQGEREYLLKFAGYPMEQAEWLTEYDIGDYFLRVWGREKRALRSIDELDDESEDEDEADDQAGDSEAATRADSVVDEDAPPVGNADEEMADVDMITDDDANASQGMRALSESDHDDDGDHIIGVEDALEQKMQGAAAKGSAEAFDRLASLPAHEEIVEMVEADNTHFIQLDFGGMNSDYINKPGPVPTMTEILERSLEREFGLPIGQTEDSVILQINDIDKWLPENLMQYC